MFLVGILSWWYGNGWKQFVSSQFKRIEATLDYFSIELLLKTLFSPFRQISAGHINGAIGDQLRGLFDKLISRFIGLFIRSMTIIIGLIVIVVQFIFGGILIIIWPVLPVFPVVGLLLTILGVRI